MSPSQLRDAAIMELQQHEEESVRPSRCKDCALALVPASVCDRTLRFFSVVKSYTVTVGRSPRSASASSRRFGDTVIAVMRVLSAAPATGGGRHWAAPRCCDCTVAVP